MVVAAPQMKCCSGRAAKLKKANFAKAKAAADANIGKKAPNRKAANKKAANKKAPGCTLCGKK